MSPTLIFIFLLLPGILFPATYSGAGADTTTIQTLNLNPTPAAIIPAFPEQSDVEGCPLDLSDDLFHAVKSACPTPKGNVYGELHRARCCPVLAAWLYSAYSATALAVPGRSPAYDMPLLPDDSETCVDGLGKALKARGIKLAPPNETCDVVYCYCGIRLHPLSCPETFHITQNGKLEGNANVKRLERDCSANGFPGLNGCSKCLNTLHMLHHNASSARNPVNRTTKMHDKDCKLMGLTWLLSKNRTSYIHTVSNVLRAMMMNPDTSDPLSCSLSSDGLPLAVDSSDISGSHSLPFIDVAVNGLLVVSLCLMMYHLFAL